MMRYELNRIVAWTVIALALGVSVAARQATGALAGKATDEAKKPYTDYAVQLRDVNTGLFVTSTPLNDKGQFSFGELTLAKRYLVELFKIKDKKVICTEGPYSLTAEKPQKLDVNINCGKVPAAFWLLAAGAGAGAAVAVATRSTSK